MTKYILVILTVMSKQQDNSSRLNIRIDKTNILDDLIYDKAKTSSFILGSFSWAPLAHRQMGCSFFRASSHFLVFFFFVVGLFLFVFVSFGAIIKVIVSVNII